jgi:hypothetical protein
MIFYEGKKNHRKGVNDRLIYKEMKAKTAVQVKMTILILYPRLGKLGRMTASGKAKSKRVTTLKLERRHL